VMLPVGFECGDVKPYAKKTLAGADFYELAQSSQTSLLRINSKRHRRRRCMDDAAAAWVNSR
jgi:hypothetical protein